VTAPADAKPASKVRHVTKAKKKLGTKSADGGKAADAKSAPRKALEIPTPRPKPPEVPSYKIALRMQNGRRFLGLVSRDKAFHKLVFAGAHHGEAAYKRHDRFVLRFVDGLDGDLELAWNQVAKLEVREVLDSAGVRAMEDAYAGMRLARSVQTEDPADPAATPPAEGGDPAAAPADPAEPKKEGAGEEIPILTEFAPTGGWTPERKKQIEWRRTVVGTFPDAREQRFLDHYDEWLPFYETWQREELVKKDPAADPSKADSRVPSKTPAQPRNRPRIQPRTGRRAPRRSPTRSLRTAAAPDRVMLLRG
jgi:hypothetical protein